MWTDVFHNEIVTLHYTNAWNRLVILMYSICCNEQANTSLATIMLTRPRFNQTPRQYYVTVTHSYCFEVKLALVSEKNSMFTKIYILIKLKFSGHKLGSSASNNVKSHDSRLTTRISVRTKCHKLCNALLLTVVYWEITLHQFDIHKPKIRLILHFISIIPLTNYSAVIYNTVHTYKQELFLHERQPNAANDLLFVWNVFRVRSYAKWHTNFRLRDF